MDKSHILNEIKRTAKANGGVPLGRQRFLTETGIKQSDWYGIHWTTWGEAIRAAGFSANALTKAYDPLVLLEKYADLSLELGRLPTYADVRLKSHNDPDYPSHSTFDRLGDKAATIAQLAEFCKSRDKYAAVAALCQQFGKAKKTPQSVEPDSDETEMGFVYLMKSGKHYKIGHTNSHGRREYELAIQLPERASTVHVIRTDDPPGIEAYWHRRFEAKRKNGEWFELDAADVAAFRRRKFM